ncbi:MAG TPA: glycosyltransferase family 9 protein [Rhodocyclaceae bacterium]
MTKPKSDSSFLVIRRDNIGDLVCTTPLLRALREHFPAARIDALVNSYNRPVLEGNPDVDHVYHYTKAKHRAAGETVLGVHARRLALMWQLRRHHYDYVILANGGYLQRPLKLARWVAPRAVIGFVPVGQAAPGIDLPVAIDTLQRHEAENIFRLLQPLGISGPVPAMRVVPQPALLAAVRARLQQLPWGTQAPLRVAVHISARKELQRWPADRFVALMRALHQRWNCAFLLFWSPGDEHNPHHPGDDRKAATIMAGAGDLPVMACPTEQLDELIAGLAACDAMVCSDGGAMHLGAGLGLPMVSFFGNSDAWKWHPWGVAHEVLQMDSRKVEDISVAAAEAAFARVMTARS